MEEEWKVAAAVCSAVLLKFRSIRIWIRQDQNLQNQFSLLQKLALQVLIDHEEMQEEEGWKVVEQYNFGLFFCC